MDPIVAAIKQLGIDHDRERVGIAVRMIPLAPRHYELAMKLLGPAAKQRLAAVPSDVLTVEGFVSGNILRYSSRSFPAASRKPGPYHLFLGVRNVAAPYDLRNGQLELQGGLLGSIPFYVGAWPTPGILGLFGVGRADLPRDAEGYGQTRLMWERQMGPITVAAPRRETLAAVSPQLKIVDSQRPAQLWLHVGDVTQSKLTQFSNALGYSRARQITEGNSHFLHSLTAQLGVAPEQALSVGERCSTASWSPPSAADSSFRNRKANSPPGSRPPSTPAPPPAVSPPSPPTSILLLSTGSAGSTPNWPWTKGSFRWTPWW